MTGKTWSLIAAFATAAGARRKLPEEFFRTLSGRHRVLLIGAGDDDPRIRGS